MSTLSRSCHIVTTVLTFHRSRHKEFSAAAPVQSRDLVRRVHYLAAFGGLEAGTLCRMFATSQVPQRTKNSVPMVANFGRLKPNREASLQKDAPHSRAPQLRERIRSCHVVTNVFYLPRVFSEALLAQRDPFLCCSSKGAKSMPCSFSRGP